MHTSSRGEVHVSDLQKKIERSSSFSSQQREINELRAQLEKLEAINTEAM